MCYAVEIQEVILEQTHRVSRSWGESMGLLARLPNMQVQPVTRLRLWKTEVQWNVSE